MWITSFVLLAAAQGIVNGYSRYGSSDYGEEDLYRDLDYWNRRDDRLDTPVSKAISAAEHSLAAAKAVVQARKYAAQALAAAQQAAKAAALAGKHSKMAAHMASSAASRSAAHLAKVPGAKSAGARPGSSLSGRRPGSLAAGGRRPGSSAAGGGRPGSSAAGGRRPGSSAAGGRRPGSSAVGGRRPGSSAGGRAGSRPTISGTPTGSSKGGSSSAAGGSKTQSFNIVLRFPTFRFNPALSQSKSPAAISLKRRMCNAMRGVFKRGEMLQCYIKSLKSGSLLVDFFLRFSPSVKDAIQRIKNAIKSGYFNGLPVQKSPLKVYNVKGVKSAAKSSSKTGCKPCKNLAPGVKIMNQSQCPTGYCATLMINPSQVMQAAAPAQPPAYPQMAAQPSYSSCPQMCQPPATQYSCPPACPPSCCSMGKK